MTEDQWWWLRIRHPRTRCFFLHWPEATPASHQNIRVYSRDGIDWARLVRKVCHACKRGVISKISLTPDVQRQGLGSLLIDRALMDGPASSNSKEVDCTDQSLSQADWMKYCSGKADTGGDGRAGTQTLAFGKAAMTVGAQTPADGSAGGEALEVAPTTVVYQAETMGSVSVNGTFAIITVKDRAPAGSAAESAPIELGGWQWIAPDGQALAEGENDASSITPNGFSGGGTIPAGAYKWRTIAFDLTEKQRGGTILYTDGDGATFRWKVPAKDSGPELAQLKKGMEGNY
ncbi:hypothetical protein ACIRP7_40995 [Streptomyces sp. NPDC102270]|uniref:hypothetical protein n=1 Tax=Streptomyces sp. NPDC102270 TaxID=3366150 RepID=UPI0037FF95CF